MSSPGARQRRRRDQYQAPHSRAELVTAVSVGVGIVVGTALMIWLLRPGGLADRQPRSSWLISVALLAALGAVWFVLSSAKKRDINTRLWLGGSLAGIVVVAVLAGFLWPSGLLRHTPPPIAIPPTSAPRATIPRFATTVPGATTPPTSAPTATTKAPTATTTAPTSSSP
jgi:cytochrome bd-type quinol oxidase subunit 2